MADISHSPERTPQWSAEARALVAQAKVLSGNKLEQLVIRLQRHSGRSKEACWRFVIQYGLKGRVDHRRWTDEEIETVREEIVKKSVDQIAKKLNRTPKAVRQMLQRNKLLLREIRCDRFSVDSLAAALHVRKAEIQFWIKQGWLQATTETQGQRSSYGIMPEALAELYKNHLPELLKRGMVNLSLFEAYVQYCFSPKHTIGEQLLDVRRDKRERGAYAALQKEPDFDEEEDDEDTCDRFQARNPMDFRPARDTGTHGE